MDGRRGGAAAAPSPGAGGTSALADYKKSRVLVADMMSEILRNKDRLVMRTMAHREAQRRVYERKLTNLKLQVETSEKETEVWKAEGIERDRTVEALNRAIWARVNDKDLVRELHGEVARREAAATASVRHSELRHEHEAAGMRQLIALLQEQLKAKEADEAALKQNLEILHHSLKMLHKKAEGIMEKNALQSVEQLISDAQQDLSSVKEIQGDPELLALAEDRQRNLQEMKGARKEIDRLINERKTLEQALRRAEQDVVQLRLKVMERDSVANNTSKKLKVVEARLDDEIGQYAQRLNDQEKAAFDSQVRFDAKIKELNIAVEDKARRMVEQAKLVDHFKNQSQDAKNEVTKVRSELLETQLRLKREAAAAQDSVKQECQQRVLEAEAKLVSATEKAQQLDMQCHRLAADLEALSKEHQSAVLRAMTLEQAQTRQQNELKEARSAAILATSSRLQLLEEVAVLESSFRHPQLGTPPEACLAGADDESHPSEATASSPLTPSRRRRSSVAVQRRVSLAASGGATPTATAGRVRRQSLSVPGAATSAARKPSLTAERVPVPDAAPPTPLSPGIVLRMSEDDLVTSPILVTPPAQGDSSVPGHRRATLPGAQAVPPYVDWPPVSSPPMASVDLSSPIARLADAALDAPSRDAAGASPAALMLAARLRTEVAESRMPTATPSRVPLLVGESSDRDGRVTKPPATTVDASVQASEAAAAPIKYQGPVTASRVNRVGGGTLRRPGHTVSVSTLPSGPDISNEPAKSATATDATAANHTHVEKSLGKASIGGLHIFSDELVGRSLIEETRALELLDLAWSGTVTAGIQNRGGRIVIQPPVASSHQVARGVPATATAMRSSTVADRELAWSPGAPHSSDPVSSLVSRATHFAAAERPSPPSESVLDVLLKPQEATRSSVLAAAAETATEVDELCDIRTALLSLGEKCLSTFGRVPPRVQALIDGVAVLLARRGALQAPPQIPVAHAGGAIVQSQSLSWLLDPEGDLRAVHNSTEFTSALLAVSASVRATDADRLSSHVISAVPALLQDHPPHGHAAPPTATPLSLVPSSAPAASLLEPPQEPAPMRSKPTENVPQKHEHMSIFPSAQLPSQHVQPAAVGGTISQPGKSVATESHVDVDQVVRQRVSPRRDANAASLEVRIGAPGETPPSAGRPASLGSEAPSTAAVQLAVLMHSVGRFLTVASNVTDRTNDASPHSRPPRAADHRSDVDEVDDRLQRLLETLRTQFAASTSERATPHRPEAVGGGPTSLPSGKEPLDDAPAPRSRRSSSSTHDTLSSSSDDGADEESPSKGSYVVFPRRTEKHGFDGTVDPGRLPIELQTTAVDVQLDLLNPRDAAQWLHASQVAAEERDNARKEVAQLLQLIANEEELVRVAQMCTLDGQPLNVDVHEPDASRYQRLEKAIAPVMSTLEQRLQALNLGDLLTGTSRTAVALAFEGEIGRVPRPSTSSWVDTLATIRDNGLRSAAGGLSETLATNDESTFELETMLRSFPRAFLRRAIEQGCTPAVSLHLVTQVANWWNGWSKRAESRSAKNAATKRDVVRRLLRLCDAMERSSQALAFECANMAGPGQGNTAATSEPLLTPVDDAAAVGASLAKSQGELAEYLLDRGRDRQMQQLRYLEASPPLAQVYFSAVRRAAKDLASGDARSIPLPPVVSHWRRGDGDGGVPFDLLASVSVGASPSTRDVCRFGAPDSNFRTFVEGARLPRVAASSALPPAMVTLRERLPTVAAPQVSRKRLLLPPKPLSFTPGPGMGRPVATPAARGGGVWTSAAKS